MYYVSGLFLVEVYLLYVYIDTKYFRKYYFQITGLNRKMTNHQLNVFCIFGKTKIFVFEGGLIQNWSLFNRK